MPQQHLRIVSRKSALALWQAEFVKAELRSLHPHLDISILGLSTRGDEIIDLPLHKTGGKGLFVKELEEALLNNLADIAVHSMKDVPASLPEDLEIAAILKREDARDAFIANNFKRFVDLPRGACVGTSSLRRQAQLAILRPDLRYEFLRGNVDTRITKLDRGEFEAIILAVAGLRRLNLQKRITEIFEPNVMLPGVGQGALGIECRREDANLKKLIGALHHAPTALCVEAERSMNKALGGNCQLPVGGLATLINPGAELDLCGMVGKPNGRKILKTKARGSSKDPQTLGMIVAQQLLQLGAEDIINACR